MTGLRHLWTVFDAGLGWAMRATCLACMSALFCVLLGMVVIRFLPVAQLSWSSEMIELLFAWLVFLGAAALWRANDHFRIEAILNRLDVTALGVPARLVVEGIALIFVALFTYYTWQLVQRAGGTSPILDWPRELWYICMPLAGVIMALYSVRNVVVLLTHPRGGIGARPVSRGDNQATPNTPDHRSTPNAAAPSQTPDAPAVDDRDAHQPTRRRAS